MKRQLRGTVAFAVCGSFCTLGAAVAQAEQLVRQGWELLPVMSYAASGLNTRFGRADEWKDRLETLTGHRVLDTLQDVEPLGPRQLARALVVAPCTGTTLARLAAGLSDTPVTLAAKSLLRVGCPVLLAVSTNDGLGASGENIARLMQRKHYYFVPYGQDDAAQKPHEPESGSHPACPLHWRLPCTVSSCSRCSGSGTEGFSFQRDKNVVYYIIIS